MLRLFKHLFRLEISRHPPSFLSCKQRRKRFSLTSSKIVWMESGSRPEFLTWKNPIVPNASRMICAWRSGVSFFKSRVGISNMVQRFLMSRASGCNELVDEDKKPRIQAPNLDDGVIALWVLE